VLMRSKVKYNLENLTFNTSFRPSVLRMEGCVFEEGSPFAASDIPNCSLEDESTVTTGGGVFVVSLVRDKEGASTDAGEDEVSRDSVL